MIRRLMYIAVFITIVGCKSSPRSNDDATDIRINDITATWKLVDGYSRDVKVKHSGPPVTYTLPKIIQVDKFLVGDHDYGHIQDWGVDIEGLMEQVSCGLTVDEGDLVCGNTFQKLIFSMVNGEIELRLSMLTLNDGIKTEWSHVATYKK